jgi:predicted transcriptional regulator
MPAPRVTIPELPETTVLPPTGMIVVEDAGITKKMSAGLIAPSSVVADHLLNPLGAHAATAISATPSATLSAGDVQGQLDLASGLIANNTSVGSANSNNLAAHLGSLVDAHDASAVSFVPAGSTTATDVQGAITEVAADASAASAANIAAINAHIAAVLGAHAAGAVSFVPTGPITATNVQDALAQIIALLP